MASGPFHAMGIFIHSENGPERDEPGLIEVRDEDGRLLLSVTWPPEK
jgi:hypothetical protein